MKTFQDLNIGDDIFCIIFNGDKVSSFVKYNVQNVEIHKDNVEFIFNQNFRAFISKEKMKNTSYFAFDDFMLYISDIQYCYDYLRALYKQKTKNHLKEMEKLDDILDEVFEIKGA